MSTLNGRSCSSPNQPRYPSYSSKTERTESFGGWLTSFTQKPQELADAGFYYTGKGDSVRCFFCGGGLNNWDPGDDPWIEHVRWFRRCEFLRKSKGQDFVDLITQGIAQEKQLLSQRTLDNGALRGAYGMGHVESAERFGASSQKGHVRSSPRRRRKESTTDDSERTTSCARRNDRVPNAVLRDDDLETDAKPYASGSGFSCAPGPSNTEIQNVLGMVGLPSTAAPVSQSVVPMPAHQGIENQGASAPSNDGENCSNVVAENKKIKEKTLCKVCYQADFCILFLPCLHLVACAQCAPAMTSCPICRIKISATMRIHFPEP